MVMPFRKKLAFEDTANPREVDFDRLWDAAFRPAIEALGYEPIRADADTGPVIVKDMLNRLRHADLVIADITIPNGNVYYEIGIRHAIKERGSILIAADGSKSLFDLSPFLSLRYPFNSGEISDDEAALIRTKLTTGLKALAGSRTPFYDLTADTVEQAFDGAANETAALQAKLLEVRLTPDPAKQKQLAAELTTEYLALTAKRLDLAIDLVLTVRDIIDWPAMLSFLQQLPQDVQNNETIQEQHCLALSGVGEHAKAISRLLQLPPSPERLGMIGGRYKRLYREEYQRRVSGQTAASVNERKFLTNAIDAYERGMMLDLNDYYCASNLPALLHLRGTKKDIAQATAVEVIIQLACQRARARNSADPFLHQTLFGAAFRSANVELLEDLVGQVETGVAWQLGTLISDIQPGLAQLPADTQVILQPFVDRLTDALRQAV